MKNKKYFPCRLVFVFFLMSIACSSVADIFSIATMNCEFLNKKKIHVKFGGKFDIKESSQRFLDNWNENERDSKFQKATDAVAKVLHSVNTDVLVLTEVGKPDEVAMLVAALRELGARYDYSLVGDSADKSTGQHIAILSKFRLKNKLNKIPGREHYYTEIDDEESESDTGLSKAIRATVEAHGKEFIVYGIHLKSERGGHESDAQRIAQASIVRRHYLDDLKEGKNIIVVGDLNDRRGDPTLKRIRGFDDIQADLIQTGRAEYFDRDKLDTRWTYEYKGIRNQIDHILISRSVRDSTRGSNGVKRIHTRTVKPSDPLASDHNALVVTLNLR